MFLNRVVIGLSGIGIALIAFGSSSYLTTEIVLAISSLALLGATIALAVSGSQQVKIAKRHVEVTKVQVQVLLLDQVMRLIEGQRDNWAFLYNLKKSLALTEGQNVANFLGAELNKAEDVAVSFDKIALFIEDQDYVTEKVLSLFGPTILEMWEILRPYIESERKTKPTRSKWVHHFEGLSNKQHERSKDIDPAS